MSNQNHHYYATTAYGWCTAATKDAAIKAVARDLGSATIGRARKSGQGGFFAHVVRVDLPEAAHYTINGYLPHTITREDGTNEARKGERVPLGPVERVLITTVAGKYQPAPADSDD